MSERKNNGAIRLEQLPQAADRALAGLTADERLKHRIMNAAREAEAQPRTRLGYRPAMALVMALVLCVGIYAAVRPMTQPQPLLTGISAGDTPTAEPALTAAGGVNGGRINAGGSAADGALWAAGTAGSFPLIGVEGRWYRLLNEPAEASAGLQGSKLGTVSTFTDEPALAAGGILSNTCAAGTAVYSVKGCGNTLVIAEVNGRRRVFQRVSFGGSALLGSEKLGDMIPAAHVVAITLSGTGSVSNAADVKRLMSLLTGSTEYEGSSTLSGSKTLILTLDNGIRLQMNAKNGKVSACGTWSCPDFFDAIEACAK